MQNELSQTLRSIRAPPEQIDQGKRVGAIKISTRCVKELQSLRDKFLQREDVLCRRRRGENGADTVARQIRWLSRHSL